MPTVNPPVKDKEGKVDQNTPVQTGSGLAPTPTPENMYKETKPPTNDPVKDKIVEEAPKTLDAVGDTKGPHSGSVYDLQTDDKNRAQKDIDEVTTAVLRWVPEYAPQARRVRIASGLDNAPKEVTPLPNLANQPKSTGGATIPSTTYAKPTGTPIPAQKAA